MSAPAWWLDRHLRALRDFGFDPTGHGSQCYTAPAAREHRGCNGFLKCPCCGLVEACSSWCSRCAASAGLTHVYKLANAAERIERLAVARRARITARPPETGFEHVAGGS